MNRLLAATAIAMSILTPSFAQGDPTLRLLIQQNGRGLVTEERALDLPKGNGQVVLPDLPSSLEAQTMQVRSQSAPRGLRVLDLVLDAEPLTQSALLRRHVGKMVALVLPDGKTRDGRVQKQGTVLSAEEPPIFLVEGKVYAGPVEAVIYPELPNGLSARPSLGMTVDNSGPARQTLELSYLTRGLSWTMDYVLVLNSSGDSAQLSGWVTLTNRSGRDFHNARVELLAGETNAIAPPLQARGFASVAKYDVSTAQESAENTESEEIFEHHLYRLRRPVTLANQQSRQTRLFESTTIPVTRRIVGTYNALPSGHEEIPLKQKLDVMLAFRNTEAKGLGMPLPDGALRAFQDDGGTRRLVGETKMDRLAVGGSADLRLGRAFDLNVERVATEFEKTGKNSFRGAWELRVSNAKKQTQRIVLRERLPGKWKIENANAKWTKPSAGVAEFVLDVPPTREGNPMVVTYGFSTEM